MHARGPFGLRLRHGPHLALPHLCTTTSVGSLAMHGLGSALHAASVSNMSCSGCCGGSQGGPARPLSATGVLTPADPGCWLGVGARRFRTERCRYGSRAECPNPLVSGGARGASSWACPPQLAMLCAVGGGTVSCRAVCVPVGHVCVVG
jgi:hypothetical protein